MFKSQNSKDIFELYRLVSELFTFQTDTEKHLLMMLKKMEELNDTNLRLSTALADTEWSKVEMAKRLTELEQTVYGEKRLKKVI